MLRIQRVPVEIRKNPLGWIRVSVHDTRLHHTSSFVVVVFFGHWSNFFMQCDTSDWST